MQKSVPAFLELRDGSFVEHPEVTLTNLRSKFEHELSETFHASLLKMSAQEWATGIVAAAISGDQESVACWTEFVALVNEYARNASKLRRRFKTALRKPEAVG